MDDVAIQLEEARAENVRLRMQLEEAYQVQDRLREAVKRAAQSAYGGGMFAAIAAHTPPEIPTEAHTSTPEPEELDLVVKMRALADELHMPPSHELRAAADEMSASHGGRRGDIVACWSRALALFRQYEQSGVTP